MDEDENAHDLDFERHHDGKRLPLSVAAPHELTADSQHLCEQPEVRDRIVLHHDLASGECACTAN